MQYYSAGDVRVVSDQEKLCNEGASQDLKLRYERQWLPEMEDLNNPYLLYLRKHSQGRPPYTNDSTLTGYYDSKYYRPKDVNLAIKSDLGCARDHKWDLVYNTIDRKECDCVTFFKVVIAVYRLWQCNSTGQLDNLGVASINPPYQPFDAMRSYWFPRKNRMSTTCSFSPHGNVLNLTHGAVNTTQISRVI